MEITIEKMVLDDVPAVIEMMREFAEYEELSEFFEATEERLAIAMFGEGAFVEGLIARARTRPAAYALFYPNYATFRGQRGFFLEDLFIRAEYRRHNLGRRMISEIAKIGASRGYERIDFQVLVTNDPAISFYLKNGARVDETERHFKFTDDAFVRLSEPPV